MGVTIQEPVGTAARAPHVHRRRGVAALGLLTVASIGLSVVGIGTGDGPLGPPPRYGAGLSTDVGHEFTEGNTFLRNSGVLPVHIESIRAVPIGDATSGAPVTAIEMVAPSSPAIGVVDGAGHDTVPRQLRRDPAGYTIAPQRGVGEQKGTAEVLVRVRVERAGSWSYRGYEVTYRSGFIRHHLVVDAHLQVCTPAGSDCLDRME